MQKTKQTSSKKIFKSKWFDIFHDKIVLPDKKKGDYYYIYTLGSVMIIPITQDNKIQVHGDFVPGFFSGNLRCSDGRVNS